MEEAIGFTEGWVILLALSVTLQVAASVWYLSAVLQHRAKLNASSWGLWSVLTFLNAASYVSIAAFPILAIIPILTTISTVVTFSTAMLTGGYSSLDRLDYIACAAGFGAAVSWLFTGSPEVASVMLQAAFVIGFLPTIRAVWQRTVHEPVGPWLLWTIAYIANLMAGVLAATDITASLLAYPLTSITLHTIVLSLAFVAAHPYFWDHRVRHFPRIRSIGM